MKRLITALMLVPIFVYLVVWSPQPVFLAAVAAVGVLCFYEYAGLVEHHNIRQPGIFGYVAGVLVLFLPRPDVLFIVLIALLALALAMTSRELTGALPFAAALIFGVLYIFGALRSGIALRGMNVYWLLFALSVNWVGDVAAYYVGRALGRHKLAPRISPGKTWEGAVASTLLSIVYGYFYFAYVLKPALPLAWAIAIAACGNIAGQIGDLCESAIKRGAGVKDSGNTLPGHGGWLDRIDSSLFSVPAVLALVKLLAR